MYVPVICHIWAKKGTIIGVAVPRALVGGWGPGPPQNFGHGSKFVGKLLSRAQVSQNNQAGPPPPPPLKLAVNSLIIIHFI